MSTNRDHALKTHSINFKKAVTRYAYLTAYSCHEHFIGGSLKHGSREHDEFNKAFNDLWDKLIVSVAEALTSGKSIS